MNFSQSTLLLYFLFSLANCFPKGVSTQIWNEKEIGYDRFARFIRLVIENYPTWLRENNEFQLPTHPNPPEYESSNNNMLFNATYKFTNEQIVSNVDENLMYFVNIFELNLYTDGKLSLNIYPSSQIGNSIEFRGDYIANGKLFNGIDFGGQGQEGEFYFFADGVSESIDYYMRYTSDGYIDISDGPSFHEAYIEPQSWGESYFEGLGDDGIGGFADIISDFMRGRYIQRVFSWQDNDSPPVKPTLHRYLEEVFNKTPLVDIIGAPLYLLGAK